MRQLMIKDGTADGSYPLDSDLHNMTDDGCPLTPDPMRWSDWDYRDSAEECPTDPAWVPLRGAARLNFRRSRSSHWNRLRAALQLRARWSAVCARLTR